MGYLSLTDADRAEMLAAIGVSSVDELFEQIPPGVRLDRELDVPPALGELVHYEAPEAGMTVSKDESYGEVESVKAVSDIIAPLSGEVLAVNDKVVAEPETVNDDPYGEGWLIRIRMSDPSELDVLLDAETYRAHVAEQ